MQNSERKGGIAQRIPPNDRRMLSNREITDNLRKIADNQADDRQSMSVIRRSSGTAYAGTLTRSNHCSAPVRLSGISVFDTHGTLQSPADGIARRRFHLKLSASRLHLADEVDHTQRSRFLAKGSDRRFDRRLLCLGQARVQWFPSSSAAKQGQDFVCLIQPLAIPIDGPPVDIEARGQLFGASLGQRISAQGTNGPGNLFESLPLGSINGFQRRCLAAYRKRLCTRILGHRQTTKRLLTIVTYLPQTATHCQ